MRIAIVHNHVSSDGSPDELDVLCQAEAVSEALRELGHKPLRLSSSLDLAATQKEIRAIEPRLVFNLVESLDGSGRLIHLFPSMLETMGMAYTGSCAEALLLTSNKVLAKTLMDDAGLPTPAWSAPDNTYRLCLRHSSREYPAHGRWIIKSVWEHASIGLDADAVVGPLVPDELGPIFERRARGMGGACFAEAFIEGREFNLSLIGDGDGAVVLPPAEILFDDFDDDEPKIVGYHAKWEETSFQYNHTRRCFDFETADEALLEELRRLAKECWALFGLNGYARVDFRVDADHRPWILEVNANPCLSTDAGFAAALRRSDLTYCQAIERIIENCRAF